MEAEYERLQAEKDALYDQQEELLEAETALEDEQTALDAEKSALAARQESLNDAKAAEEAAAYEAMTVSEKENWFVTQQEAIDLKQEFID